jgi:GTP-binding protein
MKQQIVAIIGRPNVGKSTLFNRIIRKREAIVDNISGVTRDLNYAETEWSGIKFSLIDTGGYLPEKEDAIQTAVFQQVHIAVQEADVLLFLGDAVDGLTAIDQEIGRLLQEANKPIIIVVNKADNPKLELNIAEFFKLGLGSPIPIGALSGRGIGDLLDEIIEIFPDKTALIPPDEDELNKEIKLAIIGRPNVGKSSFVNAILGYDKQIVTDIPGTTRDAIDTKFKHYGQDLLLIDTAGIRRRSRIKGSIEFYSIVRSYESIQRCDVAIILIDAVEGMTDQDQKLIEEVINRKKGIILAVNKWDLVEKDSKTAHQYEELLRKGLGGENFFPIIFISVLQKQRIFRIIELAKIVFEKRLFRVKTSDLNEFLQTILQEYPPPDFGTQQVKIKYCTQVKAAPPVFAFYLNFPEAVKSSYKKYIENKIREKFDFEGVPITIVFKRK